MDAPVLVLVPACLLHSKTQELEDSETRTRTSELGLGVGTLTWKALTRCWQAGASTRVEVAVAFPLQQPSHATANESQRWRPRLAVREAIAKARDPDERRMQPSPAPELADTGDTRADTAGRRG
ncbi:hypothetical protein BGZ57DRAFT_921955 [Hyaloscypha finlandica]|nr:hypothetical protein BGZ57DRAFT_921955 [Hyaloscypha finlandica]